MKFQTAFDTIASFLVRNNATTLEIEALNCMASYCKSVETRSRKRSQSSNNTMDEPDVSPFASAHPAAEFQAGSANLMMSPATSNTGKPRQKRKVEHTHLVKLGDGNSQTAYILRSYHDFYREADTDQACEADRNYLCEADAACLRR